MLSTDPLVRSKYPYLLPSRTEIRLFKEKLNNINANGESDPNDYLTQVIVYAGVGYTHHQDGLKAVADAAIERFLFVARQKFGKKQIEKLHQWDKQVGDSIMQQELQLNQAIIPSQKSQDQLSDISSRTMSKLSNSITNGIKRRFSKDRKNFILYKPNDPHLLQLQSKVVSKAIDLFNENMRLRDLYLMPEMFEDKDGFLQFEWEIFRKFSSWCLIGEARRVIDPKDHLTTAQKENLESQSKSSQGQQKYFRIPMTRINCGATTHNVMQFVEKTQDIVRKNKSLIQRMKEEGYGKEEWGKIGINSIPIRRDSEPNKGKQEKGTTLQNKSSLSSRWRPRHDLHFDTYKTEKEQVCYHFERALACTAEILQKIVCRDFSYQQKVGCPITNNKIPIIDQYLVWYDWKGCTFWNIRNLLNVYFTNYNFTVQSLFNSIFINTTKTNLFANIMNDLFARAANQILKQGLSELTCEKTILIGEKNEPAANGKCPATRNHSFQLDNMFEIGKSQEEIERRLDRWWEKNGEKLMRLVKRLKRNDIQEQKSNNISLDMFKDISPDKITQALSQDYSKLSKTITPHNLHHFQPSSHDITQGIFPNNEYFGKLNIMNLDHPYKPKSYIDPYYLAWYNTYHGGQQQLQETKIKLEIHPENITIPEYNPTIQDVLDWDGGRSFYEIPISEKGGFRTAGLQFDPPFSLRNVD